MLNATQLEEYGRNGYVVVRGVFGPDEVTALRDHYMALREAGSYPGDFHGVDASSADPLLRYPRMIHMHRWDEVSLRWMIDARLNRCMTEMLGGSRTRSRPCSTSSRPALAARPSTRTSST